MFTAAITRLRDRARLCRRAAFRMEPSLGRTAMERLAARWDVIAQCEQRRLERAANEP